ITRAVARVVEVRTRIAVDRRRLEVLVFELSPVVHASGADEGKEHRANTQNRSSHRKLPRTPIHAGPAATPASKLGSRSASDLGWLKKYKTTPVATPAAPMASPTFATVWLRRPASISDCLWGQGPAHSS